MNKLLHVGFAVAGIFALAGCEAQQTTVSAPAAAAPAASAPVAKPAAVVTANADGQSRVVIYRTSYMGLAVQPKVFVDGQEAGTCSPGRATTVTVAPGVHRITSQTLSEKAVEVSVPQGGTAYVRCSLNPGLVVGGVKLVQVPAAEAAPIVARMQAR